MPYVLCYIIYYTLYKIVATKLTHILEDKKNIQVLQPNFKTL